MAFRDALQYELEGRMQDLGTKRHISVRWEPGPRMVRVGVCIADYDWEHRDAALDKILEFESDHPELAVEFDIIPLEAVTSSNYAEP